MIDEKTLNLSLPLPNAENLLSEDVARLRQALTLIDATLAQINSNTDQTLRQAREDIAETLTQQTENNARELKKIRILALAGM